MSDLPRFNLPARVLHWSMAALILVMLLIGVAMVASLADYHVLVTVHRPLGFLILLLAVVRLTNRWRHPPPPLPADLPCWQRRAGPCLARRPLRAHASHAPCRLGDAGGGTRSGGPRRAVRAATDRSPQPARLRLAARAPRRAGLRAVRPHPRPSRGGAAPRLNTSGRCIRQHGALATPLGYGAPGRRLSRRPNRPACLAPSTTVVASGSASPRPLRGDGNIDRCVHAPGSRGSPDRAFLTYEIRKITS